MDRQLYVNFRLIDGTMAKPIDGAYMLVESGRISSIGKVLPEELIGIEQINLGGKSVIPGLINSHVHITMQPVGDPMSLMSRESKYITALRSAANLKKHLQSGTTFFRDVGGFDYIDLALRDAVKAGIIEGPEFLASGKLITMTGGHGWQFGREANGPDEVRKAAREQLKAGADLIKVMATGGVMTPGVEPGSPQLTEDEMRAAIEEAHKAGKRTATHAQGAKGVKNAIRAGVDSIEHGVFLDEEIIEMMLEKGTFLVPTLVAPYFIIKYGVENGIPQYIVDESKKLMSAHQDSFRRARAAGVKIAMGTDAGTPFNAHDGAPHELLLMVECGMSPMEAIVASTSVSAECLGIENDYGTLESGKHADFLVLNSNPLTDIKAVFNLERVYKKGKRVT